MFLVSGSVISLELITVKERLTLLATFLIVTDSPTLSFWYKRTLPYNGIMACISVISIYIIDLMASYTFYPSITVLPIYGIG